MMNKILSYLELSLVWETRFFKFRYISRSLFCKNDWWNFVKKLLFCHILRSHINEISNCEILCLNICIIKFHFFDYFMSRRKIKISSLFLSCTCSGRWILPTFWRRFFGTLNWKYALSLIHIHVQKLNFHIHLIESFSPSWNHGWSFQATLSSQTIWSKTYFTCVCSSTKRFVLVFVRR